MKIRTNVDPEDKGKKKRKGEAVREYRAGNEYSMDTRDPQSVTKDYSGQPAPRVGGKPRKSSGVPSGSPTVKLMKQSRKNIKKSMASKAAKRAAMQSLRNRY